MKNKWKSETEISVPEPRSEKAQNTACMGMIACLIIGMIGFYAGIPPIWGIFGGMALILAVFLFLSGLIQIFETGGSL